MKLILSGTTILDASDNVQTLSDRYSTGDAEYQFNIADALVTVDALPSDYRPGLYRYDNGFVYDPSDAILEQIEEAKRQHNAKMREEREKAYTEESDGLFFKSQRGEATIEAWKDKVAEIKARFPYQE
jgi:hypothetical protein